MVDIFSKVLPVFAYIDSVECFAMRPLMIWTSLDGLRLPQWLSPLRTEPSAHGVSPRSGAEGSSLEILTSAKMLLVF